MRIPFLAGGRSAGDDPERRKLLVAEGRVPRPFPGPWTLRALVRADTPAGDTPALETPALHSPEGEAAGGESAEATPEAGNEHGAAPSDSRAS